MFQTVFLLSFMDYLLLCETIFICNLPIYGICVSNRQKKLFGYNVSRLSKIEIHPLKKAASFQYFDGIYPKL